MLLVAVLLQASDAARVQASYDAESGTITCSIPRHDTNRYLNIGVYGFNIRTSRSDQSTGHFLTGLGDDPTTFTYQIPALDCESDPELIAECELFTSETPAIYHVARAAIPCLDPAGPYRGQE